MKLRYVIRKGLPETNSSSSHSIIISKLNKNTEINYIDLLLNENNIIKVPKVGCFLDFGNTGFTPYNITDVKLRLVISLIVSYSDSLMELGKKLNWIKTLLCNFTGADDVVFEGLEDLSKYLNHDNSGEIENLWESIGYSFGNVDHQSRESLFKEIMEEKDTILDFIFNTDSWLFLSSDSCDNDFLIKSTLSNYYNYCTDCYASINFGYNLGVVDFPLIDYPNSTTLVDNILNGHDGMLGRLEFNKETKELYLKRESSNLSESNILKASFYNYFIKANQIVQKENGDYYLIFGSIDFFKNLDNKFYLLFEKNTDDNKILLDHCNNYQEGIDYILFKIDIHLKEFNNVIL